MALPSAVQIGRIRGIPLRLHLTFFLVLPLFAYLMGRSYFTERGADVTMLGIAWGGALAVLLFVCVTLHELSHSLTAMRYGIKVRSITLLPIGGVSQMEDMPKEPMKELWVSAAGPLVNFVIALPLLGWAVLAGASLAPGGPLGALPEPRELGEFVRSAGILNLALGVFNLFLPAFPMDGGRILRAILSARMGFLKATKYAAGTGRVLALLMGLYGLFTFAFGGVWLLLIAFFIYMGATEEERSVQVMHTLGDLRVRDVMTASPVILRPEDNLDEAFRIMVESKHVGFPVVDEAGRVMGFLGLKELEEVDQERFSAIPVRAVMRAQVPTVEPGTLATEALRRMSQDGEDYLVVMDRGVLAGILSRTDLSRVVSILAVRQGAKPEELGV